MNIVPLRALDLGTKPPLGRLRSTGRSSVSLHGLPTMVSGLAARRLRAVRAILRADRAIALWAFLSVAVAGCGDRGGAPAPFTVRDSAGVAIVESRAAIWDSNTAWRLSQAPVLRIGSVDGGPVAAGVGGGSPYDFSRIVGLTRLSDGRVVMLEGQNSEVRWFAPDGTHLLTRGGRGGGPGEFNFASTLLRLPDDTIVVQDAPAIVHHFFSASGDFVRSEALDHSRYREHGQWLECGRVTLPDRSLMGCLAEPGLQSSTPDRPGHLRTFSRYHRVPWTLESRHALGLASGIEQWGVRGAEGRMVYAVHPFHSRDFVAAGGSPLRVAIALNPEYSIEIWTPEGVLERIIRRPDGRRKATSQELEIAGTRMFGSAVMDPAAANRLRAEMVVPDSIPAVLGLALGPAGDLWVKRDISPLLASAGLAGTAPLEQSTGEPTLYDVFDRDGRFLGELRFPPRYRISEVGDDYVLGVQTGEFDVPLVEMYSLDRRLSGNGLARIPSVVN